MDAVAIRTSSPFPGSVSMDGRSDAFVGCWECAGPREREFEVTMLRCVDIEKKLN